MRTPDGIRAALLRQKIWKGLFYFHEHELKSVIPQDHRILCVDETGITTVQHSKFVSTSGKQEVGSVTSAQRGNLVGPTAISTYMPPLNTLNHNPQHGVLTATKTTDEDQEKMKTSM